MHKACKHEHVMFILFCFTVLPYIQVFVFLNISTLYSARISNCSVALYRNCISQLEPGEMALSCQKVGDQYLETLSLMGYWPGKYRPTGLEASLVYLN